MTLCRDGLCRPGLTLPGKFGIFLYDKPFLKAGITVKNLYLKYKELISYIFWGVATTVVNYVVYFLCTRLFQINYLASNVISWIAAVAFAFLVNKLFVFASTSWARKTVFAELWKFVSARILSGALETGILFVFVSLLHMPDGIVKIAAGVIVVILNYIISKLFIFRKKA